MKLFRASLAALVIFLVSLVYLAAKPAKPIAKTETADSPFGLVGNNFEQARELNAFWGKILIPWQLVEPKKGEWQFDKLDRAVESAGPVNLVGLIQANASWAISCRRFVGLGSPCPPDSANDYVRFIQKVVERYQNRIKVWQIEDEIYTSARYGGSIDDYLGVLQTASGLIKQLDPTAKILLASTNLSQDKQYLAAFAQVAAATNSYDLIDVHLSGDDQEITTRLNRFNELLDDRKIKKPIWATELSSLDPVNAEELVKRHAVALGASVEKVFWYGSLDGLSRKAYTIMASLLTNYSSSRLINLDHNYQSVLFEFGSGKPLLIVWSDTGANFNTREVLAGGKLTATDLFGRRLALSGSAANLSKAPIYLVGERLVLPESTLTATSQTKQVALQLQVDRPTVRAGELLEVKLGLEGAVPPFVRLQFNFPPDLVRVRRVEHADSQFGLVVEERLDNAAGKLTLLKGSLINQRGTKATVAQVVLEALQSGRAQLGLTETSLATSVAAEITIE